MTMDYFNEKERVSQKSFARSRDRFFKPVLKTLSRLGVTANQITLAGVILLIGGVVASLFWPSAYIPSLILYVLLDGLDGPLARHQGSASAIGALNDMTADQIGVPIVLGYLAYNNYALPWISALLSGLYMITIYNMVLCNLNHTRGVFTLRLKYMFFVCGGLCSAGLLSVQPFISLFITASACYYLVMIPVNLWVAGKHMSKRSKSTGSGS